MGSTRSVLVLVLAALALVVAAVGFVVSSPRASARPSPENGTPAIEHAAAAELAEPPPEDEIRLELPGDPAQPRRSGGAARSAEAMPEDLAARFEKRYRGFGGEALVLAHSKLCEALHVRADELLRERLKAGLYRPPTGSAPTGSADATASHPGEATLTRTILRPSGAKEIRIVGIDVAREDATRELYLEIAWLAARLPAKETGS